MEKIGENKNRLRGSAKWINLKPDCPGERGGMLLLSGMSGDIRRLIREYYEQIYPNKFHSFM
jgi:hypothetical protein